MDEVDSANHLLNRMQFAASTGRTSPRVITAIKNIVAYRELIAVLVWKNITVRYKQAYLGIGWAIHKPRRVRCSRQRHRPLT